MDRVPGVSVAIATLNGARHVREQLDSIAAQTEKPIEILIGDDGSTDDTIAIINDFAATTDIPVHVTINPERLGYGENFMQTASRAHGTLIAFADQDDFWYPGRLAAAARALAEPEPALWVSGWRIVDENLQPLPDRRFHTGFQEKSAAAYPLFVLHGARMVFKGKLLDYMPADGRPETAFGKGPAHHDEWAHFAAHVVGRSVHGSEPLTLYRRHATAVSAEAPSTPSRRWLLGRVGEPPNDGVTGAARSRASYLRVRAEAPECAPVREQMLAAARYYDQIVPRLERRSQTRNGPTRRTRAARMLSGFAHGDYRPLRSGGFGLWILLQDGFALAVTPNERPMPS
ncbi:MAG: glycosyltransferase [Frankiaceae bacterium]|nr:glycosyltransferase [Frankiaceae bacterium]MBV9870272.1 glycosyltransferase [Frankiaceae bacterium]